MSETYHPQLLFLIDEEFSIPYLGRHMAVHHLYMKGRNWWGIFYRIEDCIMFFTTFSVFARRMEMVFVAFSIMFNHTHATAKDETKQRITLFQRQVGVSTAHTYNSEYGRKGQLWHHSYGSSLKIATKRVLSNVAYVFNNCVAGKMNRRAIENRWTLLAYYNNPNPFSEPIIKRQRSRKMIRAMQLVDLKFKNDEYLDYKTQKRIFDGLNQKERNQIIDYIVSTYNFLDYDALIELYGSFEKVLISIDSNAGAEYDINDDCGDHSCYQKMLRELYSICRTTKNDVEKLSDSTIRYLKGLFSTQLSIKEESIDRFLHLPRST